MSDQSVSPTDPSPSSEAPTWVAIGLDNLDSQVSMLIEETHMLFGRLAPVLKPRPDGAPGAVESVPAMSTVGERIRDVQVRLEYLRSQVWEVREALDV